MGVDRALDLGIITVGAAWALTRARVVQLGDMASSRLLRLAQMFVTLRLVSYVFRWLSSSSTKPKPKRTAKRKLFKKFKSKKGRAQKKAPRHLIVPKAVDAGRLEALFPRIKEHFKAPTLDYTKTITHSRYRKWNISSYLRVHDSWTPRTEQHMPLVAVMDPILDECTRQFTDWFNELHGLEKSKAIILNSFVTRYRAMPNEAELKKHVDGRKVEGSVVLALPTDTPFEGGALDVWDRKVSGGEIIKTRYKMKPGDILFLDNMIWHQAHPITSGERWALVIFYKVKWLRVKMAK